ncbi:MAG: hypothetical protein ACK41D_11950 [Rubricoccaceae bacterium]
MTMCRIRAVRLWSAAACLTLALGGRAASAQPRAPLTVAVSCPGYVPGCDTDFFQERLAFVRFVRDQADAEVFVLMTSQRTGGGGRGYELLFRGQGARVGGARDTLRARAEQDASEDAQRQVLLRPLALGLAHLSARAGVAEGLSVTYAAPAATSAAAETAPARDPWDAWVFSVRGSGFAQGQRSYSSLSTNASFSAARVTERWKTSLRPGVSYNRSTFTLSDDVTIVSDNMSAGAWGEVVRALGPRTSAAVLGSVRRSTFENIAYGAEIGPAFEFNVYPYAESTRRQLRLSYGLSAEAVGYVDTTIFGRLDERLVRQQGRGTAVFAQPWGSADVGLTLSHYLNRPDKYRAVLFGNASVRLARGVSVFGYTSFAFVRDQLSLPLAGATDEEILTRQRLLATSFDYFGQIGLSYTFGSVYNQAVNARFGG